MQNIWGNNAEKVYRQSMVNFKNFDYSVKNWEAYDARFYTPLAPYSNLFREPPIYWNAKDGLRGKSIALWTEQGVGDEILQGNLLKAFFESPVSEGAEVTVFCSDKMLCLFGLAFKDIKLIARGPHKPKIENLQFPMLSLGRVVKPGKLMFDGHAQPNKPVKTVGISWKSYSPGFGRKKNLEPDVLIKEAISQYGKGISIRPLQYGDEEVTRKEYLSALEKFPEIVGNEEWLKQYDCASLSQAYSAIRQCDAVVSISNYAVHLACSMRIPTTMMLTGFNGPASVIWYWGDRGNRTPWYPTLNIKRVYT